MSEVEVRSAVAIAMERHDLDKVEVSRFIDLRCAVVEPVMERWEFEALSAAEKRVAIASDALKQLQGEVIIAMNGEYLLDLTLSDESRIWVGEDLEVTLSSRTQCCVCEIGGLFCGLVHLQYGRREARVGGYHENRAYEEDLRAALYPYFTPRQLTLMESAFETTTMVDHRDDAFYNEGGCSFCQVRDAIEFGKFYDSCSDRFAAILQNVIDNGGEFCPPKIEETSLLKTPEGIT